MKRGTFIRTELIRSKTSQSEKGKIVTKKTCKKISKALKGRPLEHLPNCSCCVCRNKRGEIVIRKNEKSPFWIGDDIGYMGLHTWLYKNYGKAKHCENDNCLGRCKTYEWSNISGKYLRDRKDFQQLCRVCHKAFDKGKLTRSKNEI
jgi:hypothetical protein